MRLKLLSLSILVLAATSLWGQQTAWEKEGQSWTRIDKGAGCADTSRIKVVTSSRLVVVSESRKNVSYTWKQQVNLPFNREDAQRRLAGSSVRAYEQGGWCVVSTSGPEGQRQTSELIVAVPRRVQQCHLDSHTGSVTAKYLKADIVATTAAGNIEMDEIEGNVSARTGGGCMTFGSIKGSLRSLSGGGIIRVEKVSGEAVLETAGGDITVEQAGSWLRLSTAGNIHVGKAAQAVFAHTSGGLIEVGSSGGMVTAESGGGGIQIGSARGVRCESAGGSVRLKDVSGSVRASTATGHLYVTLGQAQALENSFLATGRGDITVFVPSNMPVTVKALNESAGWMGRIISEFSEVQIQPREVGRNRPVAAQGALNGGGPVLMLSATGGTIYLKRSK
jgi:DUF4097 and DUF4098 domain-containing protein YvlB